VKNQARIAILSQVAILFSSAPAWAQQTSGSISGTVLDSQGAAVPGAIVRVRDRSQGTVREGVTSESGNFVFTPLQPGSWDLTVEAGGFRTYEAQNITLFTSDRLNLPNIVLQVGAASESITVEASAAQIQTQSSERAGIITGSQTVNLALNGRNFVDLLKTVPGANADTQSVNGLRPDMNNLTLDGVTAIDTGNNGTGLVRLNVDAIAEFKVITNSQQAEFGRSAGSTISVVTKAGSREFHGVAYTFRRHESWNANTWRNNFEGRPRAIFRLDNPGFNLSGPVLLPKLSYNRNRDKLFFFVAGDYERRQQPEAVRSVTVPTALQRAGNFSQTREADGRPVIIRDPLTSAPFPGNIISPARFHPDGQAILNFYPAPNVEGVPNFNYQTQFSGRNNNRQWIVRGDWNVTDRNKVYVRWIDNYRDSIAPYGTLTTTNNLGLGAFDTSTPNGSIMVNLTTIITPTLTNEFITGRSFNQLNSIPVDDAWTRRRAGINFRPLFPDVDKLGIIPNMTYGGVPNPPVTDFRGIPYYNFNPTFDVTDNLAKVFSKHLVKGGFYFTRSVKDQIANQNQLYGLISFGRDTNNPGDTNWAFSNALLGNYQTYTQANNWPLASYRFFNVEWYLQDNWKIRNDLTIDFGVRFMYLQPQYEASNLLATFNPSLYDPAQRVTLYEAVGTGVNRRARNPLTGELHPAVLIGAIVPGYGNIDNGVIQAGVNGYPRALYDDRGVHYAPRVGIAWRPFGQQNTVVRAGGGIFYDRFLGNPTFTLLSNPPVTRQPQLFYGNLSTISSAAQTNFPVTVRGFDRGGYLPTVINYNITIQQALPKGILLDVGYVASLGRHLLALTPLNTPAYGSAWLPENQDPTLGAPRFDGNTTLPINFTRPYIGYGDISITNFGASSNYHSLQVSANKRLSKGLEFGVNYTWSRALGTADGNGDGLHLFDERKANYGLLAFDRGQVLIANYTWNLPGLSTALGTKNPLVRGVFDGWALSGITTMSVGAPADISYSITGVAGAVLNRRITGSEALAPRPVFTASPRLPGSERSYSRQVDATVVRTAARGSVGMDSGVRPIRSPGIHNWDVSVFKNINIGSESRRLQFRLEMFNAFNQAQFSDFARGAIFDPAGASITNLPTALGGGGGPFGFGALTTSRDPRIIQMALKFYF